jgi:hypothetical protein
MKIEKITMLIKRTQYQSIEISSEGGYDMPTSGNELVNICEEMKQEPERFASEEAWGKEENGIEIVNFKVVE